MSDIQARHDRMLAIIEKPFRGRVMREKNRYIRKSAQTILRTRALDDAEFVEHRENMRVIFERYYKRVIRLFTEDTAKQFDEKSGAVSLELKRATWEELFLAYVLEHGGAQAKITAETTRSDIQDALTSSLEAPDGVNERQLVRNILSVRGISAFRADVIARTETHNAAMYASQNSAKQIMAETGRRRKKKWVAALDERTRTSHAVMNSRPAIDIDHAFLVGGAKMQRPGDPAGGASNVVNCRCTLIYVKE
mgnify:CR=1 FL=1